MREKSLDCLANLRLIKKVLIVQSWDFHTSQLSKNVLMQNKQKLKPVIFSSDLFFKTRSDKKICGHEFLNVAQLFCCLFCDNWRSI